MTSVISVRLGFILWKRRKREDRKKGGEKMRRQEKRKSETSPFRCKQEHFKEISSFNTI